MKRRAVVRMMKRYEAGTRNGSAKRKLVAGWMRPGALLAVAIALAFGFNQGAEAQTPAAATQTSLAVSSTSRGARTLTTLTARVTDVGGSPVSSGVVTFRAGGRSLGSAVVNAEGDAVLPIGSLPAGDSQVAAVYEGDSLHRLSVSSAQQVHADTAATVDFSVTADPTSLSTPAGGFVSTTVTVTPTAGLTGYVSLSCSGLPLGAKCMFTPVNVLVGPQTASSTMQIQTIAPSGLENNQKAAGSGPGLPDYAFLFPGALALAGISLRRRLAANRAFRRALMGFALAAITLAGAIGLSACSQRYDYLKHKPGPNPGTPPGSSTVVVNAVWSNGSQVITHTAQLALTVSAAAPAK